MACPYATARNHGGTSNSNKSRFRLFNARLQIWTLPKLTLAFSTDGLTTLQNVLNDSHDPPALSLLQDPPRKPQDLDVEQLLIAPIGESSPKPHLCVRLTAFYLASMLII